jgi:predicted nucleic acid-binding protein
VKLVVAESESEALKAFLPAGDAFLCSELVLAEVPRAVARQGREPGEADEVLTRVTLIPMSRTILESAGRLDPPAVRSLDAIHLASALALGDHLESIVTYDARMQAAARNLGLAVSAPA